MTIFTHPIAALIGAVAVMGYLYGAQQLYRFAGYSDMALHTAASLIALAAGLMLAALPAGAAVAKDAYYNVPLRELKVVEGSLPDAARTACVCALGHGRSVRLHRARAGSCIRRRT